MKWSEFFRIIPAGGLKSAYLFTGAEDWLKQDALKRLRAALLPAGLEELNDTVLENVPFGQIADAAATVPFMCDKRIVTVMDWAPLLAARSANEDEECERLKQWLIAPPAGVVVVFYMRTKADARKKAARLITDLGDAVQFDPLEGAALNRWIGEQLKPQRKQMNPAAADEMVLRVGSDLTRISTELDKLCAYVGERAEIGADDVQAIVTPSLDYNVFELTAALLNGRMAEAETRAATMIDNGSKPLRILAVLIYQIRQLTHMRLGLDARQPRETIAALLGLKPFQTRQISQQCRSLSGDAFRDLYVRLVDLDYGVKTGKISETFALDRAMFEIAAQSQQINATKRGAAASK